MESIERDPPEGKKDEWQEYDGDWKTPDLVCTNCGARYMFNGFKK